ncbi:MAG: type IX secretion system membrane protein PorP/SprF [Cyclobacteriaceae bacterium]
MKKLYIITLLTLAIWSGEILAQQQVMFTQYMFNGTAINPAITGTHGTLSFTALTRKQWVGIEGAPSTQTLAIHAPSRNEQVGYGLLFMRDQIGIAKQHVVFGSYAYRIKMNNSVLSLGLQFGFTDYRQNENELNPNNFDNALTDNLRSGMKPNFGWGAYYYGDKYYVGFSIPFLVNNFFNDDELTDQRAELERHYFVMGGYVFDLSPSLKLRPNALLKIVGGAPVEVDLNANLLIQEVVWVGVSYRSFDSIDLLLELQLNSNLRLGYSYDITTSDLRRVNTGSHELMVNYRFTRKSKKILSPRYF